MFRSFFTSSILPRPFLSLPVVKQRSASRFGSPARIPPVGTVWPSAKCLGGWLGYHPLEDWHPIVVAIDSLPSLELGAVRSYLPRPRKCLHATGATLGGNVQREAAALDWTKIGFGLSTGERKDMGIQRDPERRAGTQACVGLLLRNRTRSSRLQNSSPVFCKLSMNVLWVGHLPRNGKC
ncbi:hypothetical protein FRC08_016082 [Ceratobasidium sp. 394]|nr:hypothetical protein FRC08_016082 [Ceratobasidium sp. 394]